MKKIITLLFCSALITSALAQTNHRDKRNDNRYNNNRTVYQNSNARRDQVIQKINAHYEYKIQQVSHDRYMTRREKKRAIKMLQSQKAEQIKRVYAGHNSRYVYGDNRN
ncbi:MAG: hypothetical protein ABI419_05465, partial [Ginsengibacter sp.]